MSQQQARAQLWRSGKEHLNRWGWRQQQTAFDSQVDVAGWGKDGGHRLISASEVKDLYKLTKEKLVLQY